MVNKIIKIVLVFLYALSIYSPCFMLSADTTPEQKIVKINDMLIYQMPAHQLIAKAEEMYIPVQKKTTSNGNIEYTIDDSKLSSELSYLYNNVISRSQTPNSESGGNIVLEENVNDDKNIIACIQVHKIRRLIMGIVFKS